MEPRLGSVVFGNDDAENGSIDRDMTLFQGVRFFLAGFDPEVEIQHATVIESHGGFNVGKYDQSCTHVIVHRLTYDHPICIAARSDGKILVTDLWVIDSLDMGNVVDASKILYKPVRDLNGIPGSKALCICLTGYQSQERINVMRMVEMMGARFTKPLTAKEVTHLICYLFEGQKYLFAKQLGMKLVNHRWLEDCLKTWTLVPEENYRQSGFEVEMMEAEAKDSEDEAPIQQMHLDLRLGSAPRNHPKADTLTPMKTEEVKNVYAKSKTPPISVGSVVQTGNKFKTPTPSHAQVPLTNRTSKVSKLTLDTSNKHDQGSGAKTSAVQTGSTPSSSKCDLGRLLTKKSEENQLQNSAAETLRPSTNVNDFFSSAGKEKDVLGSNGIREADQNEFASHGRLSISKGRLHAENKILEEKSNADMLASIMNQPSTPVVTPSEEVSKSKASVVEDGASEETRCDKDNSTELPFNSGSKDYAENDNICNVETGSILNNTTTNTEKEGSEDVMVHISPTSAEHQLLNSNGGKSRRILRTYGPNRKRRHCRSASQHSHLQSGSDDYDNLSMDKENKCSNAETIVNNDNGSAPQKGETGLSERNINLRSDDQLHTDEKNLKSKNDSYSFDSPSIEIPGVQQAKGRKKSMGRSRVTQRNLKQAANRISDSNTECPKPTSGNGVEAFETEVKTFEKLQEASSALTFSAGSRVPHAPGEGAKVTNASSPDKGTVPSSSVAQNAHETSKKNPKKRGRPPTGKNQFSDPPVLLNEAEGIPVQDCNTEPADTQQQSHEKFLDLDVGSPDSLEMKNSEVNVVRTGGSAVSPISKSVDNPVPAGMDDEPSPKMPSNSKRKKATGKSQGRKARKQKNGESNSHKASESVKDKCGSNSVKYNETETSVDLGGNESPSGTEETTEIQPVKPIKEKPSKALKRPREKDQAENFQKALVPQNTSHNSSYQQKIFLLSGHRFQRKEYQQLIKALRGKVLKHSHNWSYQATHLVIPEPLRRVEKFFAAAASGRWIVKADYLIESKKAGRFLNEAYYEWHKNGLNEDGTISFEAPRKWRLLRQQTGLCALQNFRIVVYGDCIAPPLDTLKRVVKAGGGEILATCPPYNRVLASGVDLAIISPGIPRDNIWIQEFLHCNVACVLVDYLVEYVCKPSYPLDKHVLYNTHAAVEAFMKSVEETRRTAMSAGVPQDESEVHDGSPTKTEDEIRCSVCGSADREEIMMLCGDDQGNGCGTAIHIDCCQPPLQAVPKEDWFCPKCQPDISSSAKKRRV